MNKRQKRNQLGERKKFGSSGLNSKDFVRSLKKETDQFKRKILWIGYFSERLAKQKADSCVVGGEAVEIYTAGQFVTGDIDVTVSDKPKAEKLLLSMGFTKEGMIWLNKDLLMAVQIVASYPSRTEKVRKIEVGDYVVKIEGVEDLVVDRLVAAKYWRSNPKSDIEQAAVLLREFRDSIDSDYLKTRAFDEEVADYLKDISSK